MRAYKDPTADAAIGNIMREEKRKRRMGWPPVYICSPYAGDIAKNTELAKRYCRFAIHQGFDPVAPHLYYTGFLNDYNMNERAVGLELGLKQIDRCREVWVFGNVVSPGMEKEIRKADALDKRVRFFNTDCQEVKRYECVDSH